MGTKMIQRKRLLRVANLPHSSHQAMIIINISIYVELFNNSDETLRLKERTHDWGSISAVDRHSLRTERAKMQVDDDNGAETAEHNASNHQIFVTVDCKDLVLVSKIAAVCDFNTRGGFVFLLPNPGRVLCKYRDLVFPFLLDYMVIGMGL